MESYIASRDPSFAAGTQSPGVALAGSQARDAEVLSRIRSALTTAPGDASAADILSQIRTLADTGPSSSTGSRGPPVSGNSRPAQPYGHGSGPGNASGPAFAPVSGQAGASGGGRYPPLPFPGTYPYSAERLTDAGRPFIGRATAGQAGTGQAGPGQAPIASMLSLRSI